MTRLEILRAVANGRMSVAKAEALLDGDFDRLRMPTPAPSPLLDQVTYHDQFGRCGDGGFVDQWGRSGR